MLDELFKIVTQFIILGDELKHKRQEETDNSLTFFRLVYFYLEFKWLRDCFAQNAYHQAIRELRFALDSMIQAYYIDRRHPDSKMECKLEIVKELDHLYGGKLIDSTDLSRAHKKSLNKLYSELCAYVHSSYKELHSILSRSPKELETLQFERDPEMEALCQGFLNQTMDAVFFVALSLFPEIPIAPEKFVRLAADLWQSLKKLSFKLTLSKWPHG